MEPLQYRILLDMLCTNHEIKQDVLMFMLCRGIALKNLLSHVVHMSDYLLSHGCV